MDKELIINSKEGNVEIALLEDKNIVELHIDKSSNKYKVGDIYLGKVKKLMPGLNAAFVEIGHEKDAFLHYTDFSPNFRTFLYYTQDCINLSSDQKLQIENVSIKPEINKSGKVVDVIKGKPNILVQILKEPISSKGPRLSGEISLPGRYVVLTPFVDNIAVSKKIKSVQERKRLSQLMESLKVKNMGVIVRTVAENISVKELQEDFEKMLSKWYEIQANLKGATAPKLIFGEEVKTNSIFRDFLNDSFTDIIVNDKEIELEAKNYIKEIAPEKLDIVKFYNSTTPIFDHYGITKQLKGLFGKNVYTKSGVSLVIEHTEACHVIDVNSGGRKSEQSQEINAFNTNIEASKEIARQMRLRDLGGIVLIDFVDMKDKENRRLVHEAMNEAMSSDRARYTILPISKFGLMQITRQRLKPELNIIVEEKCPTCDGTGKAKPGVLINEEIDNQVNILFEKGISNFLIVCNPVIKAYLQGSNIFKNIQLKWFKKHKKWIKINSDQNFTIYEYHFLNKESLEEIEL